MPRDILYLGFLQTFEGGGDWKEREKPGSFLKLVNKK